MPSRFGGTVQGFCTYITVVFVKLFVVVFISGQDVETYMYCVVLWYILLVIFGHFIGT